jgi:hypothetical protein
MTEISSSTAVADDILITSIEEPEINEQKQTDHQESSYDSSKADPKESMQRIQAQSALQQATQPNLERLRKIHTLEKELLINESLQNIGGSIPNAVIRENFSKKLALVKLLMTSYKEAHDNVTSFEEKARAYLTADIETAPKLSPLENKILTLYSSLIETAVKYNNKEVMNVGIYISYHPFYLDIEELSKDTGISIIDSRELLDLERSTLTVAMLSLFPQINRFPWIPRTFFNNQVVTYYGYILGREKMLGLTEKRSTLLANNIADLLFNIKLQKCWFSSKNGKILHDFMPFILRYGDSEAVESLISRLPKDTDKLKVENLADSITLLIRIMIKELDDGSKAMEKRIGHLFNLFKSIIDKNIYVLHPFAVNSDIIEDTYNKALLLVEEAEKAFFADKIE